MRSVLFALSLTMITGGCVEDAEDLVAAEAAIDEASIAVQAQALTARFIELVASAPTAATSEARAAELAAAVGKLLDCGTATAEGTVVTLTLPGPGCNLQGRAIWGTVTFDLAGVTDGAGITWDGLSDGGVTLTGSGDVTWDTTGGRQLTHAGTLALNDALSTLYRVGGTRTQVPDEAGVTLSGSRCIVLDEEDIDCWTVIGQEACTAIEIDCREIESLSVDLEWNLPLPRAGAHRVLLETDGWDRRVDLTYESSAEDRLEVSAEVRGVDDDAPRNGFQFEVLFP